ncbi:hypothetical protein D3D03_04870 [Exiguobacterium sp. RIT452]|uniref:hypothetical protein n=1 Tax=Exiguobacterium sp. RIT452 TaxID=2315552 RepID=UPI000E71801C|nr:hypothetical protein [Exiguobacterium sp. RIT452]RJP02684.1 hypothetical protein D3D03_04870 [Exiguobacterium sp. RIT452]
MRLVSYSAVSAIGSFLLFTAYAFVTTIENEFLYQFGTFATTLFTFAIGLPMLFITRHYPLSLRLLIYLTAGVFTILLFIGFYDYFGQMSFVESRSNLGGIIQFATLACLFYIVPYEWLYLKKRSSNHPSMSS